MNTALHPAGKPKLTNYLTGCRRKIRYTHAQTAENAVRSLTAKGSGEIHKYQCRFCGGWHVGH